MKSGMLLAGKFELLKRLGNGAMGEVWRARDRGPMSRDVAIKLMTGVLDEDLGKRFVREARVASELENPHILRVFDMGEHEGRLFIVMELLTGQDLAEVIRGRALPIRHRWWWRNDGWSEWQDFPLPDGSQVTAIAATSGSTRHQEIFGLKASGKVVHAWNWLNDDGKPDWESWSHWSEWHFMPNLP